MKNTKLILHRCGLFFMIVSMCFLFIRDMVENASNLFDYTFAHAAAILLWGLFFGVSFVIFDIKKIPDIVARLIHFILNGAATSFWIVSVQTAGDNVNSKLLQFVFIGLFVYVFLYWIIHFLAFGLSKLFEKITASIVKKQD